MAWNPLLHPRGKDGKFIEVGKWVSGLFRGLGDRSDDERQVRAKVTRLDSNPDNPQYPLVYGITNGGEEVVSQSSLVRAANPVKASLGSSQYLDTVKELQTELKEAISTLGGVGLSYDDVQESKVTLPHKGGPTPEMAQAESLTTQIGSMLDGEIKKRVEEQGGILHTPESFAAAEASLDGQEQDVLALHKAQKDVPGYDDWDYTVAWAKIVKEREKLKNARRAYRDLYAVTARKVLQEVLGEENVGGELTHVFAPNMSSKDQAKFAELISAGAEAFFPKSWLHRSTTASVPLTIRKTKLVRAFYHLLYNSISARGFEQEQVFNHEVMHYMEQIVPGVRFLEFAFYWRRVGVGSPAYKLDKLMPHSNIKPHEKTRPDEFATPYIGKDYGGSPSSSWEIMSVGVEHLLSLDHTKGSPGFAETIGKDADYRAFVLGTLVSVWPESSADPYSQGPTVESGGLDV